MVGTNDIKQSLKLYDKILPFAGMKKIESTSDYVVMQVFSVMMKKLLFILQNLIMGKMLLLVMVQ